MARVLIFRGMQEEQLRKLSMQQYLPLVKSRQRRTIKRMGLQYKALVQAIEQAKKEGSTGPIKTRCRPAVILPGWIGMKLAVHNGKEYKEFEIRPDMLGHRLGEFSYYAKLHVVHSAPGIRATRGSKFLAVK